MEKRVDIDPVVINNPDYVEEVVSKTSALRRMLSLRYKMERYKEEIEKLMPDAISEYRKVFKNAGTTEGELFKLQLSYGPTRFEFTDEVGEKERELKELRKKQKKDGSAKAIPSEKLLLKVTLKKDKIEEAINERAA